MYSNVVIDLWSCNEGTMKGFIISANLINVRLGHAGRLNPRDLKKISILLQEGLLVTLLRFMNASPAMKIIPSTLEPFRMKKTMDRNGTTIMILYIL